MIIHRPAFLDIEEATGLEVYSVTKDDATNEFKAVAEDIVKNAEKHIKDKYSNKKLTVTAGSGNIDNIVKTIFPELTRVLGKVANKISNEDPKKQYTISIPTKIQYSFSGMTFDKEVKKDAEDIMRKSGFKKGQKISGIPGSNYFYKISKDKKYIFSAYNMSPMGLNINRHFSICLSMLDNTDKIKSIIESAEIPEEKVDLTKYFSFDPNDGVDSSLINIDNDSEKAFYRDPVYNKAIMEHFNMLDTRTRKVLLSMNEAGQNSVLMSLTSKLYDKIVEKCDDIDYGDIPKTKGDITKLPNYESMKETISIMHDILKEYNQDTGPVDELSVAFSNIEARKDLFERAYRYNSELPIAMYCNITLGIITGISYMIATCIEFIKDPGAESFRIALDKMAYAKTKDHMIYNTLKSFNKTCANKEFDKAMEAVLKASTKNFGGAAIVWGIAIGLLGTILVLIPVLRELIFMFYYMRMKVSDFYSIQADLLQMNAYSVEANKSIHPDERKKIVAKQLKYVERFRKISNTFAFEIKKAEVAADKEKKNDDETKMLIDDIDGIDTKSNVSALF